MKNVFTDSSENISHLCMKSDPRNMSKIERSVLPTIIRKIPIRTDFWNTLYYNICRSCRPSCAYIIIYSFAHANVLRDFAGNCVGVPLPTAYVRSITPAQKVRFAHLLQHAYFLVFLFRRIPHTDGLIPCAGRIHII